MALLYRLAATRSPCRSVATLRASGVHKRHLSLWVLPAPCLADMQRVLNMLNQKLGGNLKFDENGPEGIKTQPEDDEL